MATIPEAFAIAVEHHQAGRLPTAEQIYRQILAVEPQHVDALHLLGVIACQVGQPAGGIEYIERAVRLKGSNPLIHSNLGNAYKELERFDEAIACYQRALALNPNLAVVHGNLGSALTEKGKLEEAVACYDRALTLQPDYVDALKNKGIALKKLGRWEESVAFHRKALELRPDDADTYNNLGTVLSSQGQWEDAIACFRRAVALKPDLASAHYNLGNALSDRKELVEAVACYRRAVELKRDYFDAYNNLGITLMEQGNLDEAAASVREALLLKPDCAEAHNKLGAILGQQGKLDESVAACCRALELDPRLHEAHNNLGTTFMFQGKRDEAIACYRRAVEVQPDHAQSHTNLALGWLLIGDWQKGWRKHEWRLKTKEAVPHSFSQPKWEGDSLAGKTILLYAEQGLGDTIQFIRFAPLVKQLGAKVVVECQKSLVRLLENCAGVDQCLGRGSTLPDFDTYSPLMSLTAVLNTSFDTIPQTVPYIHPSPTLVEQWHDWLNQLAGFKVGIHWQGNPKYIFDRFRSIPLRDFAPLAQVPNVHLISLQKGPGVTHLDEIREMFPVTVPTTELDEQSGAFMDTAALMKNLDLIITSDTATAHLAGALGVPVWVALPFAPDWRWLIDRADSPWYPTMRLFRQQQPGDWQEVFQTMKQVLCERLLSARISPGRGDIQ